MFFTSSFRDSNMSEKIDLSSFEGPLQEALLEIARSGVVDLDELNISNLPNPYIKILLKDLGSKMKNIRVFSFSNSYLSDIGLLGLAKVFPLIEELDITRQNCQDITDEGIAAMSTELKHLQRINLTGNKRISDKSLISLSSNCEFLTEIVLNDTEVTQAGISFVMGNSHNYNSLVLSPPIFCSIELTNPHTFSKCTRTIDLSSVNISDEILFGIVKGKLPLENFHLSSCRNFTINGVYSLLKAYPSLKYFSLTGTKMVTDDFVAQICQFIKKLNSINLSYCSKLTVSSFIVIASACHWISNVEIGSLSSLSQGETGVDHVASRSAKHPCITSAILTSISLEGILHICPNLRTLKVNANKGHPKEEEEVDIAFILKSYKNIRHLTLDSCERLKFPEEGQEEAEVFKLELLSATVSGIDDEVLKMVGKRCPELLYLDLEGCKSVTERGVKEVAHLCKRLKYINLKLIFRAACTRNVVAWMVGSCPSLRQIVILGRWVHTRDELDSFLR